MDILPMNTKLRTIFICAEILSVGLLPMNIKQQVLRDVRLTSTIV